jgi:hypothetical protein
MPNRINRRSLLASSLAASAPIRALAAARQGGGYGVADAFVVGFPLFEFARTAWAVAKPTPEDPGGAFNRVTHRRRLTDPTSRIITTPNNDCLVSTARIDLSMGPLLLDVPDIRDRYFSVVFMDAFTDNFFIVGTRKTGGRGGRFLLTPPGWRGRVPAATTQVEAPTIDLWLLARILIAGPAEYAKVNSLQDRIQLSGLDGPPRASPLLVPPRDVNDPANFLEVVNAMLARAPTSDSRVLNAARFRHEGLRRGARGAFANLNADLQQQWRETIPFELAALPDAGRDRRRQTNGWSYSLLSTGQFGSDDLQRALVALMGLAALPPEEAFYAHALVDAAGAPLDGSNAYRLRIPPGGPPVDAFWSLTVYQIESDGRLFLSPNPINRYSIGDRTEGLLWNADGSLDIIMQHTRPAELMAQNWLPIPKGQFRPGLRAYLARPEFLDLRWAMPAVERIA